MRLLFITEVQRQLKAIHIANLWMLKLSSPKYGLVRAYTDEESFSLA